MYITEKDKQVLSEYLSNEEIEELELFDRIKENKLLNILKNASIKGCKIDRNLYGEFLFIEFVLKDEPYFVFGLGLHEYRGKILRDFWDMNLANDYIKEQPSIDFGLVLNAIEQRKEEIEELEEFTTKETILFDILAELSDEDGALSMLY